jgi:hypothetical protein
MRSPHSVADKPRRRRCDAMLLALKRVPCDAERSSAATWADAVPPLPTRRSWRSISRARRFKAAISERYVAEAFLRAAVSRLTSLRATRAISSFKTDATFDIRCVFARTGRILGLRQQVVFSEALLPGRSEASAHGDVRREFGIQEAARHDRELVALARPRAGAGPRSQHFVAGTCPCTSFTGLKPLRSSMNTAWTEPGFGSG